MKLLKSVYKHAGRTVLTAGLTTQSLLTAYASDLSLDWLTDDTIDNDMFDGITEYFQSIFASGYGLAMTVFMAFCVFALMLIGFKFIWGGRKKEEAKDQLLSYFFGCFLIFSAISVVTLFMTVKF